jgi:hypothetical protein
VPFVLGQSLYAPRNGRSVSMTTLKSCSILETKKFGLVNRGRQQRQGKTRRCRLQNQTGLVQQRFREQFAPPSQASHAHSGQRWTFPQGPTSDGDLRTAPFCSIQNEVAEMKGTRATRWSHAVRRHVTTSWCNMSISSVFGQIWGADVRGTARGQYQALTAVGPTGVTKIRSCFDRDDRC